MGISKFSDPTAADQFLKEWNDKIIARCGRDWKSRFLESSWGKTHVLCLNEEQKNWPALLLFPGARTSGLTWELDGAIREIKQKRIYLIDVNGQATLSEGNCPDQSKMEYGKWALEIMDQLKISKAFLAGASLGGIIAMQTAILSPDRVIKTGLLNPAGLTSFSMSIKNLFQNLRPIITRKRKHINSFLNTIVLNAPEHSLQQDAFNLLAEYQHYVMKEHHFKGKFPAKIPDSQILKFHTKALLLLGDKDPLFPFSKTIKRAVRLFPVKPDIEVIRGAAHGIETMPLALLKLNEWFDKSENLSQSPLQT